MTMSNDTVTDLIPIIMCKRWSASCQIKHSRQDQCDTSSGINGEFVTAHVYFFMDGKAVL